MRTSCFLAVLCTLPLFAAPGLPEKKGEPKDDEAAKPYVTSVTAKDNILVVQRQIIRLVQEQRTRQVVLGDGTRMNVIETVTVPVMVTESISLDPKGLEIQKPDGKTVDAADVAKTFKDPTQVIISPNGKAVPEELRKKHKDAFIILVKPKK